MVGRQYFFAGSTVALLMTMGFGVALDGACSPAPAVDAGNPEAGVCNPDSGDTAYCPCDPSTYKTTECYTGPPGTNAQGICQTGKRSCNTNGTLTPCVGEVTPKPEVCNLADDNCDGIVDNVPEIADAAPIAYCTSPACTGTYADAAIYCWGTDPGICGAGTKACAPGEQGGTPTGCNEFIKTGVAEVCNGIDDDCNGAVDDGLTNEGSCDVDDGSVWGDASPFTDGGPQQVLGQCVHGQLSCIAAQDTCTPSQPSVETCNGKDDNCNGTVDEHTCTSSTYNYCCSYGTNYGSCETASFAQSYLDAGGFYWCKLAYP